MFGGSLDPMGGGGFGVDAGGGFVDNYNNSANITGSATKPFEKKVNIAFLRYQQ